MRILMIRTPALVRQSHHTLQEASEKRSASGNLIIEIARNRECDGQKQKWS